MANFLDDNSMSSSYSSIFEDEDSDNSDITKSETTTNAKDDQTTYSSKDEIELKKLSNNMKARFNKKISEKKASYLHDPDFAERIEAMDMLGWDKEFIILPKKVFKKTGYV